MKLRLYSFPAIAIAAILFAMTSGPNGQLSDQAPITPVSALRVTHAGPHHHCTDGDV